jgi:hypothetical protein
MANDLGDFANRVGKLADPGVARAMARKAGDAAKKSALKAAERDLGGDRSFSGMRRKSKLNAGYDDAGAGLVQLNFRPAGLWVLAQAGRRSSGTIRPKRKRAVLTPQGPRASSSYGPSRGLNTFDDAVEDARRTAPKAAAEQFRAEIAKVVRG